MYTIFRSLALRMMKAPTEPPDPPLGSHDSVQVFRASPKFLTYSLIALTLGSLASYLLPLLLVMVGLINGELPPVIIGVVIVPLFAVFQFILYFSIRIDYDMRYYIVTDRSLRVREGAFTVKEKTISYANVQNMRVVQGPLLRYFGIWHLKIDTAGGGGASEKGEHGSNAHRVQMAGIENAHLVRDKILGHLKQRGAGAGLGDVDDHHEKGSKLLSASPELIGALRELKESTSALRGAAVSRS